MKMKYTNLINITATAATTQLSELYIFGLAGNCTQRNKKCLEHKIPLKIWRRTKG